MDKFSKINMVMKMKKENRKKLINSFKYAFEGIFSSFKTEQNMKIHVILMILVIIFGIILKISKFEWIICIILFGFVISLELINTAIENIVDLITVEKNPKAKLIKDVSAGAVLIAAIASAIVGLIIFIPYILLLF